LSELDTKIKKKILGRNCPKHQRQVEIFIVNGKMTFLACCKEFENSIIKAKNEVIQDYLIKSKKRMD